MTYDICIHTRLSISCIAQYRGVLQRILTLDAVGLKGVWAFQNVVFGTIALEVFEQLLTWQSSKRRAANGQTFGISQRRTNQIWSGTYNLWQGTTFTHSCCKTNQIYPIISLSQIKYMNDLTHLLQNFQKTLDILSPRHYFYKLQQHHRNCLRFETALKNTMYQIQMNTTNWSEMNEFLQSWNFNYLDESKKFHKLVLTLIFLDPNCHHSV